MEFVGMPGAGIRGGRVAVLTLGALHPRELLEVDNDIAVVAAVNSPEQIPRVLARTVVHVVVLRMSETPHETLELARDLTEQHPATGIVVWDAPYSAEDLLDAVEVGIRGYALRGITPEQLRRVIRAVAAGDPALPRRLMGDMLDVLLRRRQEREEALRQLWRLTERERRVLHLLMEARSNSAIGAALHISPQTVRKHVQHVLTKLGVHSRLEAVMFVHRHAIEDELTA